MRTKLSFFFFFPEKIKKKKHQKVALELESLLFKSEFLNSFAFVTYLSKIYLQKQ